MPKLEILDKRRFTEKIEDLWYLVYLVCKIGKIGEIAKSSDRVELLQQMKIGDSVFEIRKTTKKRPIGAPFWKKKSIAHSERGSSWRKNEI